MNKAEKQVKAASLRNEATVIRQMRENFKEARANIEEKIKVLAEREQTKSVIWQRQYQEQLKEQLDTAIEVLSTKNYANIREYLTGEYENGYLGTMYSLQKNGVPVIMPIDQKAVAKMIETTGDNIKLSKKLYEHVTKLKNTVRREVSIGLASGESWQQVAARIGRAHDIGYNSAVRIARTEGHRVTEVSGFDAAMAARQSGADIVKQWDSTLDGATRFTHRKLDGEIRELDDKFSNGAIVPGQSGIASEDINCRCACLFRPRWAVTGGDDSYTKYSKLPDGMTREEWLNAPPLSGVRQRGGGIVDLSDSKNFSEFKQRYKDAAKTFTAQAAAASVGIEVMGAIPEIDPLRPEELAGVKRGEPMTFEEADGNKPNPNFYEDRGYQINCQSCVVSYEARRRGYKVETRSRKNNPTADKLAYYTNKAWKDPKTGKNPDYITDTSVTNAAKCYKWLDETVKPNQRYTFEFCWKGRNSGHIIHADRMEDGTLRLYDPQIGKSYTGEDLQNYLTRLKYGRKKWTRPLLLRVDNAAFDEDVAKNIMKGAKK